MSTSPLLAWQSAANEAHFSEPAECARRAGRFERGIRIRNAIEYGAGALVTVLFSGAALGAFYKGEVMIGLSCIAILIGTFVALRELHRRGSNLDRRPEDSCVTHLRRQYERQYEALRSVPRWYVGPFIPGIMLFYFAVTAGVAEVIGWQDAIVGIAGPAAISFGIISVILAANWLAARSLKRKIEAMDALA